MMQCAISTVSLAQGNRAGLVLLAMDVDLLTFCFLEQSTGQGLLKFEVTN